MFGFQLDRTELGSFRRHHCLVAFHRPSINWMWVVLHGHLKATIQDAAGFHEGPVMSSNAPLMHNILWYKPYKLWKLYNWYCLQKLLRNWQVFDFHEWLRLKSIHDYNSEFFNIKAVSSFWGCGMDEEKKTKLIMMISKKEGDRQTNSHRKRETTREQQWANLLKTERKRKRTMKKQKVTEKEGVCMYGCVCVWERN